MVPSSQSASHLSLSRGDLWRSKRDGRVFEVEYVQAGRLGAQPRVQLKPARAKNLKTTRWIDIDNLPRLYDYMAENDEPVSMLDLEAGDLWEWGTGKRVEIIDRAFLWGGQRLVAVLDHDFPDRPVLFEVRRFNDARLVDG